MALRGEPSDFTSVLHSGTSTGTGLKFGITALPGIQTPGWQK